MSERGQYDSRINEILHERGEPIQDAKKLLEEIFDKSQQDLQLIDIDYYNESIEKYVEGMFIEITGRSISIIDDFGNIEPATIEYCDVDRYNDGFYPCIKEATIDGLFLEKDILDKDVLMYHGTFWHDQGTDLMQFLTPVKSSNIKICDEEEILSYYVMKENIDSIGDLRTQDQLYKMYDSLSRLKEFGEKTIDSLKFAVNELKQIDLRNLTDHQKYVVEDMLYSTIFYDNKLALDIKTKSVEEIDSNSRKWRRYVDNRNHFDLYGPPAAIIIENNTPYLFIREYFDDEGEIHDENIIRIPLKDIVGLKEDE